VAHIVAPTLAATSRSGYAAGSMPTIPEREVQHETMLQIGQLPFLRIWRQNVGKARAFDNPRRVISFGPPKGAADLSGLLACGRRLEVECKTAIGHQSTEQVMFQDMIEHLGGIYLLVRSADDAKKQLASHVQACSVCASKKTWTD